MAKRKSTKRKSKRHPHPNYGRYLAAKKKLIKLCFGTRSAVSCKVERV